MSALRSKRMEVVMTGDLFQGFRGSVIVALGRKVAVRTIVGANITRQRAVLPALTVTRAVIERDRGNGLASCPNLQGD